MEKYEFIEYTADAVVVGAGHAGCEAALALARTGLDTVMLTLNNKFGIKRKESSLPFLSIRSLRTSSPSISPTGGSF